MWKRLLIASILACATFGAIAADTDYPSRPIRIIDAFSVGGTTDFIVRLIGPKLTERFGQPIVLETRLGGGGNIGAEYAARSKPDGYTLFMGLTSALAPARSLFPKKLNYDLLKDFAYISTVASAPVVLVAHPSMPVKTVAQFVNFARARPKQILYGSSGIGAPVHLTMEMLMSRAGMNMVHVPYKGSGIAISALVAGEIQVAFLSIAASIPMINARRVNALAVSSAQRVGALPGVPTVAESGYPGFLMLNTYGLFAPADTPANIINPLNAEIRRIVQMEEIKTRFAAQALDASGSTPAEFKAIVETEVTQWARVIKDANITATY